MENFNAKVNEASSKYLSRRGYEIIEEPWKDNDGLLPVDLVVRDDDTVVFVRTKGRKAEEGRFFDDDGLDRSKLEAFAIDWFEKNQDDYADCPFRFDVVSMVVIGADKALLRHHVNALSVEYDPEEE